MNIFYLLICTFFLMVNIMKYHKLSDLNNGKFILFQILKNLNIRYRLHKVFGFLGKGIFVPFLSLVSGG